MFASGFGCVRIAGLFGPAQSPTPPAAGVCEPICDPLADNDYDGSGSASIRTGSACGSDESIGCYGNITDTGDRTHFACMKPLDGTGMLVHRDVIPANLLQINSCHPGYTIAFAADATGSTNIDCYAYCRPGNSYFGSPTQEPNGKPGAQCRAGSGGRQGNFGTPASETENGEHCMYSWQFEVDGNGAIHHSNTSDTLGICFDHAKYTADFDNDPSTPNTVLPPCAAMPLHATTPGEPDAASFGCVDSITAGNSISRRRSPLTMPPL
jgi:hypothetical protein